MEYLRINWSWEYLSTGLRVLPASRLLILILSVRVTTNTSADTWSYEGKNYTLNSQNTIRQKTQYVCENGFGGIMSWDLATDVDVTHEMSLLKAVKEELDYYANPTVE